MEADSMSDLTLFDEPRLVTGQRETSKAAAEHVGPKRGTQRFRVLAWVVAHGPAVEETITRCSQVHQNGGRLRLAELEHAGYVERLTKTGLTSAGHKALLWKATEAGARAIQEAA
jgi:predicted ArsR family transcriptional regulator